MQISFDPLQKEEAAAVRAMLDALHAQQVGYNPTVPDIIAHRHQDLQFPAMDHLFSSAEIAAKSDAQFHTIVQPQADGHLPTSATPLAPPAPSTAAADLFATAPAAPMDGRAPAASPPPVPAPPAPSAPAASPSPAGVDSTGLPWDERIHSGTKAKNADGTWRARRGLNNPALVKQVEAELRQLAGIPVSAGPLSQPAAPAPDLGELSQTEVDALRATVPAAPPIPAPPVASATTPVGSTETPTLAPVAVPPAPPAVASDVPNAATTTSAPPTAPIPSPPAPDAPPAAPAAPITFGALMTKLAKAVNERRITAEQVDEIVARHGIPKGGMGQLVGKLDLVQLIDTEATLLGA